MDARKTLGAREAREIARVLIHPNAEPLPESARLGLGQRAAIHEGAKRHERLRTSYTSPAAGVTGRRRSSTAAVRGELCSRERMPKVTHASGTLETLRLEDEATGSLVSLAPARGGMVTRFAVGATPVLFLDETTLADPTKSVRGGIPVLFPIAGKLPGDRYDVTGRTFSMKQHGFARSLPWTVLDESTRDGASVTLGLEASDATRAQYPFEFALRFTYRLRGEVLTVEQLFENRGPVPMPVHPGVHPYFFVPDVSKPGVRVDTDATRAIDNRTGDEVPVTRPIALAGREVDLFLLDHEPRHTVLHRPDLPGVRIGFGDDQALLVVWTLPGRDFVCVEPWRTRPGALAAGTAPRIAPGDSESTTLTLSLVR
jgi:galactose mutarotase-like enzyme